MSARIISFPTPQPGEAFDDLFETRVCGNCGYFQHDHRIEHWCRLWKRTQLLRDKGCKDWSHGEFHQ